MKKLEENLEEIKKQNGFLLLLLLNSVQSGNKRTLVYRCTRDCNYKYGFGQQRN